MRVEIDDLKRQVEQLTSRDEKLRERVNEITQAVITEINANNLVVIYGGIEVDVADRLPSTPVGGDMMPESASVQDDLARETGLTTSEVVDPFLDVEIEISRARMTRPSER